VPFVGEIRSFAFGGNRNSPTIEKLRAAGWLECAGQVIPKTGFKDIYDLLIDTQPWGISDAGVKIPDLRGVFLRGWTHGRSGIDDEVDPIGWTKFHPFLDGAAG
jgi:microcystin-dependent protein